MAVMMILPSWVRADEMPGYVKGDNFDSASTTRLMKAAGCPYGSRLTARECARIREIDRARKRAEARRAPARERVYVVERDRGRQDRREAIGTCVPKVIAYKGSKNVIGGIARYNAREAWRREIRSEFGTQFQDIDFARQKNTRCWDEGAFVRCEFKARACRAGQGD